MESGTTEEVYASILLEIHSLTQLAGISHELSKSPTDEVGEQLIKIIDNCENKFLKVKEKVVKMVRDIEKENGIIGIQTENGFLIKEQQ